MMNRAAGRLAAAAMLLATVIIAACSPAGAGSNLPGDIELTALIAGAAGNQDIIVAGTLEDGVLVSRDRGNTWHPSEGLPTGTSEGPPPGTAVIDLAIAGDGLTVFAATSAGLFKSMDSGRSWANSGGSGSYELTAAWQVSLAPDYAETGLVAAIGSGHNFGDSTLISMDNGETWAPVEGGSAARTVQALANNTIGMARRDNLTIQQVAPQQSEQVLQETDGIIRATFSPAFDNDGLVFVGGGVRGTDTLRRIYTISGEVVDSGLHAMCYLWRDNLAYAITGSGGFGPSRHCYADAAVLSPSFASDGTGVAITSGNGLARTTDSGLTWHSVSVPTPGHEPLRAVAFAPDFAESQALYAVTDRRLLRSTDSGDTWQAIPSLDDRPPEPTSTPSPSPPPQGSPPPDATAAPNQ
ncbi:MAG: hypothetical protein WD208_12420 [Dehalococcoidia bacterium]